MGSESWNKATACVHVQYVHVTWPSHIHMQAITWVINIVKTIYIFKLNSIFHEFNSDFKGIYISRSRSISINLKINKDDGKNFSSGIPELHLWFIVAVDQLWPHFALVLMSLCNPVLPDSLTLLGSKSHVAAASKNRNYPLNPRQDFFKATVIIFHPANKDL